MNENENWNGELLANTIITDEGIIFLDEWKLSKKDLKRIEQCEINLDHIWTKYGTLDLWELMDKNISFGDMKDYLTARYVLRAYDRYEGKEDI